MKCSLGFDPRFGPVVEIGKLAAKTIERIRSVILGQKELYILESGFKGTLRFGDPTWTSLYHDSRNSETELLKVESKIFSECCETIKKSSDSILLVCVALSELDISVHAALFSQQNNYIRPIMTKEF